MMQYNNSETEPKDKEYICETRQTKIQKIKHDNRGLSRTEVIILISGVCLVIGVILAVILIKSSRDSSETEANPIVEAEEIKEELSEDNIDNNANKEIKEPQSEESGIKIELDENSETLEISGSGVLTREKMTEDIDVNKQAAIKKVLISDEVVIENGESSKKMFDGFDSLEYVELPNTMTSLEESFFNECKSLVSVNLPENLISIGEKAFEGCDSLVTIDIPDTVTDIGIYAFHECGSLSSVRIPKGVNTVPARAFVGCSALEEVTLEEGVQIIAQEAFWDCSKLKNVCFPDSIVEIGDKAFSSCSALSGVQLPVNLNKIGSEAFSMCSNAFTELVIPEGVEEIGSGCFSYCNFTDVVIKTESVQMGSAPFFGCENMKTMTLPNALSSSERNILSSIHSKPEVVYY